MTIAYDCRGFIVVEGKRELVYEITFSPSIPPFMVLLTRFLLTILCPDFAQSISFSPLYQFISLFSFAQLISLSFFVSASPIVDEHVLAMSRTLFMSPAPISAVIGARLLSQLITERPTVIEPVAESILVQMVTRYDPDGAHVCSFIRYRWWILKVMSDLFEAYGPTVQLSRPSESLQCLTKAICSDPVIRCKVC